MRSLVVLLLALVPVSALAQLTVSIGQQNEGSYGADDCGVTVTATWTLVPSTLGACTNITFWLTTESSCNDYKPPAGQNPVGAVPVTTTPGFPAQNSGQISFPVTQLPLFQGNDPASCPAADREVEYRLCGGYQNPSTATGACDGNGGRTVTNNPPIVRYDTKPPGTPTLSGVQPLDGGAAISVSAGDDTHVVIVEATAEGQESRSAEQDARNGRIILMGLVNGIEYQVTARARDLAGNESEPSAAVTVTPVETAGFWQAYKDAGGQDQGGCSQAGGGALGLGALLLARFFGRRRS